MHLAWPLLAAKKSGVVPSSSSRLGSAPSSSAHCSSLALPCRASCRSAGSNGMMAVVGHCLWPAVTLLLASDAEQRLIAATHDQDAAQRPKAGTRARRRQRFRSSVKTLAKITAIASRALTDRIRIDCQARQKSATPALRTLVPRPHAFAAAIEAIKPCCSLHRRSLEA